MKQCRKYIEVAVALPVFQTFTYQTPDHLTESVEVGKRVWAPFGARHVAGYVLGEARPVDTASIKPISDVLDNVALFPADMVRLFRWTAEYYMHPIGEVIRTALPGGINALDVSVAGIAEEGRRALALNMPTDSERKLLEVLNQKDCGLRSLYARSGWNFSQLLVQSLVRRGWIHLYRKVQAGSSRPRMETFLSVLRTDLPEDRHLETRGRILNLVGAHGEMSVKSLRMQLPDAAGFLPFLVNRGFLGKAEKQVFRDPFGEPIDPDRAPVLTHEQEAALAQIEALSEKGFGTCLLAGVTGSGKTEVYLAAAQRAISRGASVLILVPEIGLISQMERRFRARFGASIAVLHSALSAGERYDQWIRIARKEAVIVIGARSAVFAPLERIGLIVVDEEHDGSYKQDTGLRYNARDLAVVRARMHGAVALLGSATPSVQSFYNVTNKNFVELCLNSRINQMDLPEITLVDLRETRDARGIFRFITPPLHAAMKETLAREEQVLLFLNRRGFSSYPVCSSCGEALRCKNCDITLTLHQQANAYKCHLCGFSKAASSPCPYCGQSRILQLGLGTEKVEAAVRSLFPQARVARLDQDVAQKKGAVLHILKSLQNRSIDILIGTQMVAKGHDFPDITLVGVICADLSMNFPDFRAGERTFQLLAQVAGRAGRGRKSGRVILQTYNPTHFTIQAARMQDFRSFYQKEIEFRKALKYPPFTRMVQIRISGTEKAVVEACALSLARRCKALESQDGYRQCIDVLGPIEAPLARVARQYRWQILVKSPQVSRLHAFVRQLVFEDTDSFPSRKARISVDVDPFAMM